MKQTPTSTAGIASAAPRTRRTLPDFAIDGTEGVLFSFAVAVEQRDRQAAGHCERLVFTSVVLGMALKLDEASLRALFRGGYLHDIGKVGIPDSILFKPGILTADEWVTMRTHPARGEEICRHLKAFKPVLPVIRHHHEKWDGSGYPDGLRGSEIPLLARVVQLADIYDALTNSRSYKPAYTPAEALRIIEEETARGWRDPELVRLFVTLHRDVVLKVAEYTAPQDSGLLNLGQTLATLQHLVA